MVDEGGLRVDGGRVAAGWLAGAGHGLVTC